MTVTEKIQELLVAASKVLALVPASRIRAPGTWQNLIRPYIIHFPVSPTPLYTHDGLESFREWSYQVSIFADTFSSGEAVAAAVRDTLPGVHALSSPVTDGVTIFWNPGMWYIGREENDTAPNVEHFALSLTVHEAL